MSVPLGSRWLVDTCRMTVSPFGARVADLLDIVVGGLHRVETLVRKTDWSNDHCVSLHVRGGYLGSPSTYDGSDLTLLIVLCHQECVRLEISSALVPYELPDPKEVAAQLRKWMDASADGGGPLGEVIRYELTPAAGDPKKLAAAVRALRQMFASGMVPDGATRTGEVLEILAPDEYAAAIEVHDAVTNAGYDADEVLGLPALHYLFTHREPEGTSHMTHPTILPAVKTMLRVIADSKARRG